MHEMIANTAEGWNTSPRAVLEPPMMLRGVADAPQISAAFWHTGGTRPCVVSADRNETYATLAFHLDTEFKMDLLVDRQDLFRGRSGPGDFCLIPSGRLPEAEVTGPAPVLHIYMPQDLVTRLVPASVMGEPLFGRNPRMTKPIGDLIKWRDQLDGSVDTQLAAYGALLHTVSTLSRGLGPADTGERLTPAMVRRVRDLMAAHLGAPLKVAELAHALDLSEAHFARAFRNTTDQTPGEALRDLRMEKARDLLENDTLGMIDVAAEIGYADPSHFARVFRETYGMSPAKWQKDRRHHLLNTGRHV